MSENAREAAIDADLARRLGETETETETRVEGTGSQSGYRRRFAVIYLSLALVAGIGLGALVVLLAKPDAGPSQIWSRWQPEGSETARVRQIADHVSTRYRFPSGDQLVVALAGPPTVTAGGGAAETNPIPVRTIAVRPDTSTGKAEEDDIAIVDASTSLQFQLCGLGLNCSISQGEASEARHSLLRREALELSLYTFKYVDGVDSVTIFLPPPPGGETPGSAVFLRRSDVRDELSRPLSRTIAPGAPSIGGINRAELQTLNRITSDRLYQYEYTQAQDLSAVLILNPIVL